MVGHEGCHAVALAHSGGGQGLLQAGDGSEELAEGPALPDAILAPEDQRFVVRPAGAQEVLREVETRAGKEAGPGHLASVDEHFGPL